MASCSLLHQSKRRCFLGSVDDRAFNPFSRLTKVVFAQGHVPKRNIFRSGMTHQYLQGGQRRADTLPEAQERPAQIVRGDQLPTAIDDAFECGSKVLDTKDRVLALFGPPPFLEPTSSTWDRCTW